MKTFTLLSITLYLLLGVPVQVQAQWANAARMLSMESRAVTGLRSAEYFSNFSRSSAGVSEILGATRNSSIYGNHVLEVQRSIAGSIFDRSEMNEPNWSSIANNHPNMDRFFVTPTLGSDRYRMANITDLNVLELEPYLKHQYEVALYSIMKYKGKTKLNHLDSLQAFKLLYLTSSNSIRSSAFSMTNAGGGGRWGGNYPPTITPGMNEYNTWEEPAKKHEEEDFDEDDNGDNEENDDQDSDRDSTQNDSTRHSAVLKLENKHTSAAKFPVDPTGILLMVVLYWLFSTIGLFKMSQRAGLHGDIALVPFLRLGQLFQLAGYQPWTALLLLVPGVNIYYWINLNLKLCKSNLFSAYWAVLGVFIPGLFWLVLGQTHLEGVEEQR